jgi:hypothetical protein
MGDDGSDLGLRRLARVAAEGKGLEFELRSRAFSGSAEGGYAAIARASASPSAVKVAVHRLRRRFRDGAGECPDGRHWARVEEEVQYLLAVLRR